MPGNTFGHSFRITTWGESHGNAVGVVVDGVPAGLELSEVDVQKELDRRRPGQSEVSTPRSESDTVEILSGVFGGVTTGTPVSMFVRNRNANPGAYDYIKDIPRPGHADLFYMEKYGFRDHRGGGRSSGRETIGRVAGGAIAKKLLMFFGIEVFAHVIELGGIKAGPVTFEAIRDNVERTAVRSADLEAAEKMLEQVRLARDEGDSIGGIVEIIATGMPIGLGEPVFGKLDADIAGGLMSIGAVKGVEVGVGFECARMKGSQMNDAFLVDDGQIVPESNNAGGIIGGLSTGLPLICRAAVKPTPSISKKQKSVNVASMEETGIEIHGRHDPTIPPRMVPVAEAMVALVLTDHMIRGGRMNPEYLLK
ncbi:chorismate synthase [Methanolobus halotolerans]|uniref:Chorismate synthase n=1 Tax=Methanolobus halotolerans TaxID=2052935 RepID=A0A4E0PWD9_9EURY|nr:chorismate synthase [Methanolobus halotolerans]TGC08753.1 chorismate synthase [Methanolobus halotolerans]